MGRLACKMKWNRRKSGGRKVIAYSSNQQALLSISYVFCVEDKALNKADTILAHIGFLLLAALFMQQSTQDLRRVLIRVLIPANEVQALLLIFN